MAASRVQCQECGTVFHGRTDARYCSSACRQKAHRARAIRRAAQETVSASELGSAVARARNVRQQARIARMRAGAARRAAAQTLDKVHQSKPDEAHA